MPMNRSPSRKEIRTFGLTLLIGFGVIALLFLFRGRVHRATWAGGMGTFIFVLSALFPTLAKPFYWTWMGLSAVLGWVTSRVIMTVIFLVILTPLGLFFRIMGRDPLRLKKSSFPKESFWQPHPERFDKSSYDHLY